MQIAIPDFDEDDYLTPGPFGKSGASTSLFGGHGSGQDSPTLSSTPLPDRSFHARGDSITSEDSGSSLPHISRKPATSFAHSAQSSVTKEPSHNTPATPFAKKTSFASLRNAFKTGKTTNDTPPVPPLDQAYPVLKNPFNRSTSSLAQNPPSNRRPSINTASPRPMTPVSEVKYLRRTPSRSRTHSYARNQHSRSGSLFHSLDNGSDGGFGYGPSSSPPPVPPVPNAFGHSFRSETPPGWDYEDKVLIEPQTPSDYALHAIFMRFASAAEAKMERFLKQPIEREPSLPEYMGSGVDIKFDELLGSLGRIGQRHAKPVLESIMRWRRSQNDSVGPEYSRSHVVQSPHTNRGVRFPDASVILNERKSLAAIYIMCRALIAVVQSLPKDALSDQTGFNLEETMFEQFRKPDLKLLAQSANHRCNAELFAKLLGLLTNVRFIGVTDRFLAELRPVSSGQVLKDIDLRYENLVRGLRHVRLKVWPPETFEESAEFLESLSKSFENAHGVRFKSVFAETLMEILHPTGKTIQAEVNDPQWAKAIKTIVPKAKDMVSKPRYWIVAYPLYITSLCVAPLEYFQQNWVACFEAGLNKLKEKPARVPVMNGMMRLIWTYCFRCNEPPSTATAKLEPLLRHFFPPNRHSIFPHDDRLEPFIFILHYIMSRHLDFGTNFCMELLNEGPIRNSQSLNLSNLLAPERISIAIQSILLSLYIIEKEESSPPWPSSSEFSHPPVRKDMEMSSDVLPPSVLSHAGVKSLMERCGPTLALIASSCANNVGNMVVLDDQWSYARVNPSYEEAQDYITRRHPEGSVTYPISLVPQINVLKLCFQAWPRLLHPSLPLNDALDMLIRGTVHVEPMVRDIAEATLKRFMVDPEHASALLSRFAILLFDPSGISSERSGLKMFVDCKRLLDLWVELVEEWIQGILRNASKAPPMSSPTTGSLAEEEWKRVERRLEEIEAAGLFLLANISSQALSVGVKTIRILGILYAQLGRQASTMVNVLHGRTSRPYLTGFDDHLEEPDLDRLEQWRASKKDDVPLRVADSRDIRDRDLWDHIYSSIIQECMDHPTSALIKFREMLIASATKYHPFIASSAGLSNRAPRSATVGGTNIHGNAGQSRLGPGDTSIHVYQWRSWVKIICVTASVTDSRPVLNNVASINTPRDHARVLSDNNFDRERMTTSRGLFRYLAPFLDAEHSVFRHAAVFCISSLPPHGYPQLLEDLNSLAQRQFFDESRSKSAQFQPAPGRTRRHIRFHTAVTRIYFLTANSLSEQRSAGRQAALAHVLKFVRQTQSYLTSPDNRDLYTLQRLRRYFCGTVERVFEGLETIKDSDRFIPPKIHLSLYRLCEEWCQFGKQSDVVKRRLILMQKTAATGAPEPQLQAEAIERFQTETKQLSSAAVGALALLCRRAFFPPDVSSGSPTDTVLMDQLRPLEAAPTLDRLIAIMASYKPTMQALGKKMLRSLLTGGSQDISLTGEALRRAYVSTKELDTSNVRFFEVVADVVSSEITHGFSFSQVVCLGLSNLCHPAARVRLQSFNMVERIHEQYSGIISLAPHEAGIGSCAPGTHLHAHRLISDVLAGEHPDQAMSVLSQLDDWLLFLQECGTITLTLLQSLEYWISNIDLTDESKSQLSRRGRTCMYHLIALTLRFSETYPEQVLVLWTRLVEPPNQSNGLAAARFLLEQSPKIASTAFIDCAAKVVACLAQSVVGRSLYSEICEIIEPARMLPTMEHKLRLPPEDDLEMWSDLDILFSSDQPRLVLGAAQFALLFLSDVALDRHWETATELPILLHALVVHLDHRMPYLRKNARRMLFQLLRAWAPKYDEILDRGCHKSRSQVKLLIDGLEKDSQTLVWTDENTTQDVEPKMKEICRRILEILTPLHPKLPEQWGSVALAWGTACSIRAIAFRSLQIFRALMPRVNKADLALLLGRLSNTVASEDENIQLFTAEIILTLRSLADLDDLDPSLVPQLFWCACACLSTTVEAEFKEVVSFLTALLGRIDLDDPRTAELLTSSRPSDWEGDSSLQPALLVGLRSSETSDATIKLLCGLVKVQDDRLIDPSEGRVRDLYTLILPYCLRDMVQDSNTDYLNNFALDLAALAQEDGRHTIVRVMTSFAKRRFRTKEDFTRECVATLREHYSADHWTDVVTLLMGLVLNQDKTMKVHAMQILKVLFHQKDTRNPVGQVGSELLMPLLRMLETDLAAQALDVLDEPIVIANSMPAKHVLRMSMHIGSHLSRNLGSEADVFGVPLESGWSIPKPELAREICRTNVMAVFDTCKVPARPSRIDFEPEDLIMLSTESVHDEDLGDLVQNLHELSTFFQEPSPEKQPMPNTRLEARVAAILAKSAADAPQTPFVDVFRVGGLDDYGDSDDDSASDSGSDLFEYDAAITSISSAHASPPTNLSPR